MDNDSDAESFVGSMVNCANDNVQRPDDIASSSNNNDDSSPPPEKRRKIGEEDE